MKVSPFELERLQSLHEHQVEINLSESGVLPLNVSELLGPRTADALLDQPLAYTQTNGTAELRAAIAATLPGAMENEVLVTNGGAEANFVACWRLVEPGRRGGGDAAELRPGARSGGRLRRHRPTMAPAGAAHRLRCALGARPRRAAGAGDRPNQADRHLQSEQPDRRAADGGGGGSPLRDRWPARGLGAVRRDLPRRRARRRGDTDGVGTDRASGSSPAGCRRPTACPACASAGRSAPRAWRPACGAAATTRRLHREH